MKIALLFIVATVLIIFGIVNAQKELDNRFRNWSNLCRENGGVVQLVYGSQYECFKNGKVILHIE